MRFFLIAFALLAQPVQSQTVQSGEHPSFTRFVITLTEGIGWTISRDTRGYLFRMDQELEFDLSGAFDIIPRTRVISLTQQPQALLFESDCNCHIDAFQLNSAQVVIDVVDGPPPEDLAFQLTEPEGVEITEDEPQTVEERPRRQPFLPVILAPSDRQSRLAFNFSNEFEGAMSEADMSASLPTDDARISILQSISRGASQGVVDPVTPTIEVPQLTREQPSEPRELAPVEIPQESLPIRTITAIEREQSNFGGPRTNLGGPCIPDNRLNVSDWADQADPFPVIAELEAALYDERDQFNAETALNLARAYIAIGFGAEARAILRLDANVPDAGLLNVMSYIVEGLRPDPVALVSQVECDNAIALWALVALDEASSELALQPQPILLSFSFLPDHLQSIIAGPLSDRLRQAGEIEAARQVLRIIEPETETPVPSQRMAEAAILADDGDVEAASTELAAAAFDPVLADAEALAILIELRLAENLPISDDTLDMAQAVAYQLSGTDIATRLKKAEIRGHISRGRLAIAQTELIETEEDISSVWSDLAIAHAETSSVDAFLRFAASPPTQGLSDEAEIRLAERLVEVGLPRLALPYLDGEAKPPLEQYRRYLRAKVFALEGDLERVEQVLAGMDGPEALDLRLLAAERSGNPQAIFRIANQAEGGPTTEQSWRAGAWESLADDQSDPMIQQAARIMAARSEAIEETGFGAEGQLDPGTIAERQALIAGSQSSRETISSLLAEFPAPSDP